MLFFTLTLGMVHCVWYKSHLLFVYDDRLDLAFHIAAITEMLRVAREVRIFPLVAEVMAHFGAEIVEVGFEFQPRADAMMRITR